MIVAVGELELELDTPKERRGRMEDEAVAAGIEPVCEAGAAVVVGRRLSRSLGATEELDRDSCRRPPGGGVEHVGRERDAHVGNFRACDAMGLRDLRLVGARRAAVADDVLAADDEQVDAVRAGEDDPGDEVVGASELEPVGAPDGEVGALARLQRADVVAAEHGRAAARAEPDRLARRQRRRRRRARARRGAPA